MLVGVVTFIEPTRNRVDHAQQIKISGSLIKIPMDSVFCDSCFLSQYCQKVCREKVSKGPHWYPVQI